jgi:hypothetical protein
VVVGLSLEVSEVMRVPGCGGGAGNEVRKAWLVVGFVFVQVERRHLSRWCRRRHTSALKVWPLVIEEDSRFAYSSLSVFWWLS